MIIAYLGVAGSGKDYQSDLRVKEGFTRVDFKDGLIDMASDLCGYNVREDYDWFKGNVIGMRKGQYPDNDVANKSVQLQVHFPEIMTGRRLLQRLGTEVMRKRDENYWVNCFIETIREVVRDKNIVNGDCRFLNEVTAIYSIPCKSKFIFCNYKSSRYNANFNHTSEYLAQALLKQGLKDLQEVEHSHFLEADKIMKRKNKIGV